MYNLVNICKYPEDSTDRIIRDVLIVGCNSNHARDKIIRQGEAVSLNQVIEILQTEESTHSTKQQIQDYQRKPAASIHYQSYDSRSKKSKAPSNKQNSSSSSSDSTESKRRCFRCGEPFSRKHMKECRAKDVKCNGCGIKVISRNVARSQVTSQKILIDRISLPQVQPRLTMSIQHHYLRQKQISLMRKGS